MKTFRFNENVIEYEDDAQFNGNEFIRDLLSDKTTQFHESESTKRCEIQTNGNVRLSEESTKRSNNMATMCNSELGIGLSKLLVAFAAGFAAYKMSTSFMNPQPTNPTPETPQNQPEEKKE